MRAIKNLMPTAKNKKKKRTSRDDDEGMMTAAATNDGGPGNGGQGPMRFAPRTTPKKTKEKVTERERRAEKPPPTVAAAAPLPEPAIPTIPDAAAAPAAAAAPPPRAAAPAAAAAAGTPRKKPSGAPRGASRMDAPTCLIPAAPGASPVPDPIIDPERDVRGVQGRDPDNMTPDQMKNLRAFVAQYDTLGVKGLLEEFETIKGYNLIPFEIATHEANPTKNRYKDIFCVEPTRVKLADGKEGDYVHANFVRGEPFVNQFITTQGPIEATVNDFWRLVVQENVAYVFMLCSIVELGKKKCEMYYPDTEGETKTYLDFKVTLVQKREDAHFINSKLVLDVPGKQKRYVYHHYWKNWPDRGVPMTALAGLRLLRHARLTKYSSIVHCSAGVGRTGTLVAIEWLMQKICTTPPPYDMKEMLRAIRNQRAHAIQTGPQYAYVAYAIFRLMAIREEAAKPAFFKFSADMQAATGVKIDGGVPAPAPPRPPGP